MLLFSVHCMNAELQVLTIPKMAVVFSRLAVDVLLYDLALTADLSTCAGCN